MANQMAMGAYAIGIRVGHPFRATERNQAAIVFDELIGICRAESPGVKEEVFLNFLAHHIGQNQPADARHAQREERLIQPPQSDNTPGQDVGIQEEANLPWASHEWERFPGWRRPFPFEVRAP